MRALIWLIGLFALATGLAMVTGVNTGYVLVVVPPYRAQLSVNMLIVLFLLSFVAVYLLVRLVSRTLALPGQVGAWRARRRREKAGEALREALRASFEGRFAQAVKFAGRAFSAGESPAVAALVAARAAHAMRDETRYRIWLGRAADQDAEARVARLMTEAELAIEGRRFDEAAERLEVLRLSGHRNIAALRLSLRVMSALERWDEVLRLARQLRKHKALSEEQAAPLIRRAHLERMRELAGDSAALARYWQQIPAADLKDRRLVERAVPYLAAAGQGALARDTVEARLDSEWDPALARLYGYCGEDDPVACLAKAEGWLKRHPRDAGLLHALGRLCLAAQLWGKAQSYLEASLNLEPAVETHLALAALFERLQRADDAHDQYQAAAQRSAGATADGLRLPAPV